MWIEKKMPWESQDEALRVAYNEFGVLLSQFDEIGNHGPTWYLYCFMPKDKIEDKSEEDIFEMARSMTYRERGATLGDHHKLLFPEMYKEKARKKYKI